MNKELEEAVGILKIMIENLKEYGIYHSTTDEEQQAIETVLEELKRLQEENEELKLEKRTRIIGRYGEMEIHEVINKTLQEDYILKDKIREKIKEQNELKEKYLEMKEYGQVDIRLYKIAILEELLEGK